jgi:hypothetical protein
MDATAGIHSRGCANLALDCGNANSAAQLGEHPSQGRRSVAFSI